MIGIGRLTTCLESLNQASASSLCQNINPPQAIHFPLLLKAEKAILSFSSISMDFSAASVKSNASSMYQSSALNRSILITLSPSQRQYKVLWPDKGR
jgi:hypothetical protein